MKGQLFLLASAPIVILSACFFVLFKVKVSLWVGGIVVVAGLGAIAFIGFLILAAFNGALEVISFSEVHSVSGHFVYKSLQMLPELLPKEIERLEKDVLKIEKVNQLFSAGQVCIQCVKIDPPSMLKKMSTFRSCIGLIFKDSNLVDEILLEQLEGVPGLNAKTDLQSSKVLMAKFPLSSSLAKKIAPIKMEYALAKYLKQNKDELQDIYNNGILFAPLCELYMKGEVTFLIPRGPGVLKYSQLTHFRKPEYRTLST